MRTRCVVWVVLCALTLVVWGHNALAQYAGVYKRDSAGWHRMDTPAMMGGRDTATFAAVDVLPDGRVWVIGGHGSAHRYEGIAWQSWPAYTVEYSRPDVAALGWDQVYVSGRNYRKLISTYDGTTWSDTTGDELPVPAGSSRWERLGRLGN